MYDIRDNVIKIIPLLQAPDRDPRYLSFLSSKTFSSSRPRINPRWLGLSFKKV